MNTSSVIAMLQDKLPKNHAQLKTLEDKLNSLDETKINDLVSKIQQLNLKSPTIVFWVGSFVFGVLGVNRFITGANLTWSAKTSHFSSSCRSFYSHNQCDTLCSCKRYKRISAKYHQTNRSKQFYSWYFGCCRNHLMIAYLSNQQKQNLEKILKAIGKQA